jgi:hypothetical protein
MKSYISTNRFIFTESFAFQIPEHDKKKHLMKEMYKSLPIVSLNQQKTLKEAMKKRKIWQKNRQDGVIYDVRFSKARITRLAMEIFGLGPIILIIRLIATFMKHQDRHRTCLNPHLLTEDQYDICDGYTNSPGSLYDRLLEKYPYDEDYCHNMANRDHIQNPHMLFKSLYPDPVHESHLPIKTNPEMPHVCNIL